METKKYISIDGIEYRVEINFNTVEFWEKLSGLSLGQFEVESANSANSGGVSALLMV